jgi:hypothetical protein
MYTYTHDMRLFYNILCLVHLRYNMLYKRRENSCLNARGARCFCFLCFYDGLRTIDLGADRLIFLKIHNPNVHVARAPDRQSNTPRIYSNKSLSFSNKNLRYGQEIMSCEVVNENREKTSLYFQKNRICFSHKKLRKVAPWIQIFHKN